MLKNCLELTGRKQQEGAENLRKEELLDLHSNPDIIRMNKSRRVRRAMYVLRTGEKRNAQRLLVTTPEGKRQTGRPRYRYDYGIKTAHSLQSFYTI
jgi:hypothetical protein